MTAAGGVMCVCWIMLPANVFCFCVDVMIVSKTQFIVIACLAVRMLVFICCGYTGVLTSP